MSSKKPMTAAERQRQYRKRRDADSERRQEYLEKERQIWTRKEKAISELTESERRRKRKYWKDAQEKTWAQRRLMHQCTPPDTPTETTALS